MTSALRKLRTRGRLQFDIPLGPRTWFRTGGPAEALFFPADTEDLADVMQQLKGAVPITLLGASSNVIIRDGGIQGLVVKLGGAFSQITLEGDTIIAGAAALDTSVAEQAAAWGITGFEFLTGIPGSVGGAVIMNAGAHGADTSAILVWADVLTPGNEVQRLTRQELGFKYRHATLPNDAIVVRAGFRGAKDEPARIRQLMAEVKAQRNLSQPTRARTGGSTFRNPDGHKAWALIDAAGCRGLRLGDAQVSEKHCNFLLNLGQATSAELESLGERVRDKVFHHANIQLDWEIKILGITA